MTLEDHLREEFDSTFGDNPLATAFDIYTAAYGHGLRDGQIIAEQPLLANKPKPKDSEKAKRRALPMVLMPPLTSPPLISTTE